MWATGARSPAHGGAIDRPRVGFLLDGILDHRLTTVTAGAGAGKTSAVRAWADHRNVAWHTVTEVDKAPGEVARSVISPLRLRVPELPADLWVATKGAEGEGRRAEAVAARIGFELAAAQLERDVVLVLDDLDRLGEARAGVRFVEALCRNVPAAVHVVLISRDPIAFTVVRHALEGQLLQIDAEQLAFTVEETTALLARLRPAAPTQLAEQVHRQTGGWAAISRLAIEAIGATGGPLTELQRRIGAGDELLAEYLTQEVLLAETASTLALLRAAAALPWVCRELIDVLPVADGLASLNRIAHRGLYLASSERHPGALVLVPTMREHLARLQPDADGLATLRVAAGNWYRSVGAYVEAIIAYREAGATEQIAALLEAHGSMLLAEGRVAMLIETSAGLPASLRSPAIVLLEGEARHAAGDWEGALVCYEQLVTPSGPLPAALAWRLGQLRYLRGELEQAEEVFGRAASGDTPSDNAMTDAWAAASAWVRGDLERARTLARRALATARAANDERSLAAAHTALAMVAASDGDRLANDAHYLRALDHAERARDVLQLIRIRVNRGSRSLEEGSYAEALTELDVALRLSDVLGIASFRALALANRGKVLQYLGRLEEATADLEESRSLFRRMGSLMESYPLSHLGDTYLLRGERALSRAAYESAIELADKAGDAQGLVGALAGLARLLAREDPAAARALVGRALTFESAIEHVAASVADGWVWIEAGRPDMALERADAAATIARRRRNRAALAEALELAAAALPERAPDLMEEVRSIWDELGDPVRVALADVELARLGATDDPRHLAESATRRLRRLGAPGRADLCERLMQQALAGAGSSVSIRTMGGFAIWHEGDERPSAQFKSKKARDLLKMLISAGARPVNREVLLDRLWPDEEPFATSNRLSVALSTVRAVLDPARKWPADHFVQTDREAVILVREHLDIDVGAFLRHAEEGVRLVKGGDSRLGIVHLEQAEAKYGGDFLEEDLYEEWAIPMRERARALYFEVAGLLAEHATRAADHEYATRLYLRVLERDPYHEPAHLELVRSMIRLGQHGTARRQYGMYVARMDELALVPAPFPDAGLAFRDR